MSYLLPHLHSEEERVVVIRFGHDWDDTCMQVYYSILLVLLSLSPFQFSLLVIELMKIIIYYTLHMF